MFCSNILASFTSERIGAYAALISAILMSISVATAQGIEGYIGDMELNATRFTVQAVLSALALSLLKLPPIVERIQIGWVAGVCVLQFVGNYTYYAAAPLLPVGIVCGIETTGLMFFGMIFQCVIKRSIKLSEVVAVIVCATGVALATQPTFLGFAAEKKSNANRTVPICGVNTTTPVDDQTYITNSTMHRLPTTDVGQVWGIDATTRGYIVAVVATVMTFANQAIYNNRIPNINFLIILFWTSIFSSLTSYAMTFTLEIPTLPIGAGCWGLFFGHNVSIAVASGLMVYAGQRLPPFLYGLLLSTGLFALAILQYTILSHIQPGHRNWQGILGIVLILVGNIIKPLGDMWSARREDHWTSNNEGNKVKYGPLPSADLTSTK